MNVSFRIVGSCCMRTKKAVSGRRSCRKIHDAYYNAIDGTDILFIANVGKNGVLGYVGPNAFAEISFAVGLNFVRKRKIRVILQNMPMDESSYGEALRIWIKNGWMEIFDEISIQ